MSNKPTPLFASLDRMQLHTISGGAGKSSNDQLTTMLTGITDSIKGLAGSKNQQQDPMQMVMMMMMMGSSKGGGAAPAAAVAPPPVINISTNVRR